jgi:hypothetical protein
MYGCVILEIIAVYLGFILKIKLIRMNEFSIIEK